MYNACVQPCIDRALQRMLQTQPGTTLYEAPADVHWGCFVKLPTKLPVTIWPEFCQLCIYIYVYMFIDIYTVISQEFSHMLHETGIFTQPFGFLIYGVPSTAG